MMSEYDGSEYTVKKQSRITLVFFGVNDPEIERVLLSSLDHFFTSIHEDLPVIPLVGIRGTGLQGREAEGIHGRSILPGGGFLLPAPFPKITPSFRHPAVDCVDERLYVCIIMYIAQPGR